MDNTIYFTELLTKNNVPQHRIDVVLEGLNKIFTQSISEEEFDLLKNNPDCILLITLVVHPIKELFNSVFQPLGKISSITKNNSETVNKMLDDRINTVGVILSCHTLIEDLMDKLLIQQLGISAKQLDKRKLSFSTKVGMLELIKNNNKFINALLNLKDIRNSLAHEFTFPIQNLITTEIDNYLKDEEGIDLVSMDAISKIKKLTQNCIIYYGFTLPEVKEEFDKLTILFGDNNSIRFSSKI